jgi:hypothetical protein
MDVQGQGHEEVRPRKTSLIYLYVHIERRKKNGSIIIITQQNVDSVGKKELIVLCIYI